MLNDLRIPGSRANIDHLVVTAHLVYVIDAKRYVGKRPTRRVDGGLFNPRREVLLVDGRNRTQLVEGVRKQVRLVKEVLAGQPDVPVRGVLCFVEADWPLIGVRSRWRGCRSRTPAGCGPSWVKPGTWAPTESPTSSLRCTKLSRVREPDAKA